jgi:Tfp pilus assembly protein PilF
MEDDLAGRRIAKARALIDAGNYDGAIEELKAALSLDPDRAFAQALLAACYLDKGDPKSARSEAEDALSRAPDLILAHHVVGLAHLRDKDFVSAENAFRRAAEIDPQSAESHRLLAILFDAQAKHDLAREAFEEALRLEPDNGAVISSYADFLADKGEIAAAEALIDEAPDHVREDVGMLIVRGKLALRQGDGETARDFALWVLQHDAQNAAAIHLLCETKIRKNPLMAVWLGYARFMRRFDGKTRILVLIGLWLGYNVFARTVLRGAPDGVQLGISALWLGFCLLTWIAPGVLGAMVERELKSVQFKREF